MNFTNITDRLMEQNFSCRRHRIICLQLYVPPLGTVAMINIALNVLLSVTAVFGNSLIFAAYYQKRSLRSPANTILLSLAATDFITGTIMQPFFIYEMLLMLGDCDDKICDLYVNFFSRPFMGFTILATLLNLALSTVDRYIAICYSYRYVELMTNSRVKKVLVILWLCAMFAPLSKYLGNKIFTAVAHLFIICSSIILITFLYLKVYQEIRRLESHSVVALNDSEEERKARERKGAKTVAIILAALVLCFLPIMLAGFRYVLFAHESLVFSETLFLFGKTAAFSNSSFNVLIYYWRNEDMQKAMLTVIKKITRRSVNPE